MEDPVKKVVAFIEQENCFAVLGQLQRLGVLSKDDIRKAMGMKRSDWISFMKKKAGIAGPDINVEGGRNVE
ncbi:MAG TPA: hypothetical protein PKH33_10330 [bacterium]|nr:hypothetical protein [bacterium]